jgi:hypothetical protein
MSNFNVFGDVSKLSDEEIFDQIAKLNDRIAYYYMSEYSYLVPQLQAWRDMRMDAIDERAAKRAADKKKNKENNVIFDNSTEVLDEEKAAQDKIKEEKEKLLKPKK